MPNEPWFPAPDRQALSLVIVGGAFGGALSWLFARVGDAPLPAAWHLLVYVLLGVGAGIVGVFMIARTDRNAAVHLLALAVAFGFGWKPLYESLDAMLKREMTEQAAAAVNAKARQLDDASRDLEKVAEDMADEGEGGPEESGPVDHTAQLEALRSRIQAIATTPLPLPPPPPP